MRHLQTFAVGATLFSLFLCISFFVLLSNMQGSWITHKQSKCAAQKCLCESVTGTLVQQPVNTFSALSFCFVACTVIIFSAHTLSKSENQQSVYASDKNSIFWIYVFYFALINFIIGMNSAFFHASLTYWPELLDNFGMHIILCWALTYNFVRFAPLRVKHLLFTATFVSLSLFVVAIGTFLPQFMAVLFFIILVLLYIMSQFVVDYSLEKVSIRYFLMFLGIAASAIALLFRSIDKKQLFCDSESWIQGHAIWHCGGALFSLFIFAFYFSEQEKPIDYSIAQSISNRFDLEMQDRIPENSVSEDKDQVAENVQNPFVLTEKQEINLLRQMQRFDPHKFLAKHYDFEAQRLK